MSQRIRNRILLGLIVFLSAASIAMVSRAERRAPEIKVLPQQGQGDKPVEQTRKNIQVLKGLPESQLSLLMNFVSVSLGVQCDYCHIFQGKDPKTGYRNWLYERDDKPEKEAARRMMKMVLSINTSNPTDFRQNSVTCFTCHRGQTTTVGLPPMPLVKSGHEPGPNAAASATAPPVRPSVDQIFAKYLEALGGPKATNTKTLVMKGKREASQNRNWPIEITYVPPDKLLLVTTTPQAVVRQIVNGDQGWALTGTNLRVLTPAEVADSRRNGEETFGVVKAKQAPGMNFSGVQKIGEREAYVITKTSDVKTEFYYFDSVSGLLIRKMNIRHTSLLPIPEQVDYEDYRDVDGVKLPFTIRYSGIDTYNGWTRTFSEIKRDVTVEESTFAKPPAPK